MRNANYFIIPVLLFGIAAALFFVFTDKKYAEMKGLQREVGVRKEALKNVETLIKKRSDLEAKLNAIGQQNIADLKKILPDNVDTVRLVMDLNGIAENYNLQLKNIAVTDPREVVASGQASASQARTSKNDAVKATSAKYDVLPISFQVTSSYEDFESFLRDMEESLKILDVISINLKPGKEGVRLYEFAVTAQTYWLK